MARRRILVVLAGATLCSAYGLRLPHRSAEGRTGQEQRPKNDCPPGRYSRDKENSRFKAAMVRLQAEVNKAEAEVKRQKEKVRAERNEVEKLPGGSDERKRRRTSPTAWRPQSPPRSKFKKRPLSGRKPRSIKRPTTS